MIYVEMTNGLGNQMFQYALFYKLKSLGKDVLFDMSRVEEDNDACMKLDCFFDVDLPKADNRLMNAYRDNHTDIISRVRKHFWGKNLRHVYIDREDGYQDEIFMLDNKLLLGYWQSEKYFEDVKEDIRKTFVFKDCMTDYQRKIYNRIETCEAVSIHIRRGDYISKYPEVYGGICSEEYYKKAMSLFGKDVHFFVFSNDYEYAISKFNIERCTIVKPEARMPFTNMDMFLMSKCKHNIIANSSFSWWGAWLNQNVDKRVVAPKKWLNTIDVKDIHCDGWILL